MGGHRYKIIMLCLYLCLYLYFTNENIETKNLLKSSQGLEISWNPDLSKLQSIYFFHFYLKYTFLRERPKDNCLLTMLARM